MNQETIQLLTLAITSVTAVALAVVGYLTAVLNKAQKEIAQSQLVVKDQIVALEKNTNSIKDALVAATAKLSHAEGKIEGKSEAKAEQAVYAKGELAGHSKDKKASD